tara:strand:- start:844 stop:1449 length:606 start_codon:yes stop_codon:yes gene_type:complete
MLKIGVTGGMGSGKSTVCNLFRNLGVPIFSSDLKARGLLNTNTDIKKKMKSHFGKDIYLSNGEIDRPRLASIIFSDPNEMEFVTHVVHPEVKLLFKKWHKEYEYTPYVIKEAAILFESGAYHDIDKVITVFAPKEQRINRVIKRDQSRREDILKRMRAQFSDEERNSLADFIIMNEDGNEDQLLPQVMELHDIFLNETKKW